MKINLPIANTECVLNDTGSIDSETDMGSVNNDFLRINGIGEEELIGAPYNITLHPDMPSEVLVDWWNSLNAGKSWGGLLKRRRKDGDFYWELANATPYRKNGQLAGITFVRTEPTRPQVGKADAVYRQFRAGMAGKTSNLKTENGVVVSYGLRHKIKLLKNLILNAAMTLVGGMMSLLLLLIGSTGDRAEQIKNLLLQYLSGNFWRSSIWVRPR